MKILFITFITVLALQASAVDLTTYQSRITQVVDLEKSGQTRAALILSAQTSQEISAQLNVDQVVAQISSNIEEIRQEVVTQKTNVKGGLRLLFFSLSGRAHWDAAEIITINPQEVAGFSRKIQSDFLTLQKGLAKYVRDNELAITYAKAFAAKTLQLANQLTAAERAPLSQMIYGTAQQAQKMIFFGQQNISQCVTTHYADRSRGAGLKLSGLLLSFNFSAEQTQLAHTKSECLSSSRLASTTDDAAISARISAVDLLIEEQLKQLGLNEVLQNQAPYYPTWGLN